MVRALGYVRQQVRRCKGVNGPKGQRERKTGYQTVEERTWSERVYGRTETNIRGGGSRRREGKRRGRGFRGGGRKGGRGGIRGGGGSKDLACTFFPPRTLEV